MAAAREDLPEDIEALRAALLAERARAARVEAELAVARARASDDTALIAQLPFPSPPALDHNYFLHVGQYISRCRLFRAPAVDTVTL